jgi:flagellar biogenesis protein FliO
VTAITKKNKCGAAFARQSLSINSRLGADVIPPGKPTDSNPWVFQHSEAFTYFCLIWILGLTVCGSAPYTRAETSPPAPTTQPAAIAAPAIKDAFTDQPINRHGIPDSAAGSKQIADDPSLKPVGFDAMRVVTVLSGIIVLIFLLRAAVRHWFPGAVSQRATKAMKVVTRFSIAPRQNLLLVQVGKRLVMVGDSGAQLNPLCEITDSDEVNEILTQIREESISAARKFDLLFGRARKDFGGTAGEQVEGDIAPVEITPQTDVEAEVQETPFDSSHEINDPSIAATRQELSGLSEKVKDLARQLGNA